MWVLIKMIRVKME